jgi:hypothetical protein
MLGPHTSVAIAQIVFYVPIVPITLFILIRNWNNRPRMAWYPLFTFSLGMRYPHVYAGLD